MPRVSARIRRSSAACTASSCPAGRSIRVPESRQNAHGWPARGGWSAVRACRCGSSRFRARARAHREAPTLPLSLAAAGAGCSVGRVPPRPCPSRASVTVTSPPRVLAAKRDGGDRHRAPRADVRSRAARDPRLGRISAVFGPLFAHAGRLRRQVRMPEPPLLLADRVPGIDAEPGVARQGHDLDRDRRHAGTAGTSTTGCMPAGRHDRVPARPTCCSSRWLGIDVKNNRGERVYRLLGCELTYHGALPPPGDTLRYDIHCRRPRQPGRRPPLLLPLRLPRRRRPAAQRARRAGRASSPTQELARLRRHPLAARDAGASPRRRRSTPPPVADEQRAFSADGGPRVRRGSRPATCFGPRLRAHADARPHAAHPDRPHAASCRRRRPFDPQRRAVEARLPARRARRPSRRLVLRGALQERPVHARHAHVRGLPAGDGVLPRRAWASRSIATAGASSP